MEDFLKAVGALVIIPLVMIAAYIFNGWILAKLWAWFAVPIFGIRPLGIVEAIGVAMVVGWMTHDSRPLKGKEQAWYVTAGVYIIGGLLTLGSGYIVHRMMP